MKEKVREERREGWRCLETRWREREKEGVGFGRKREKGAEANGRRRGKRLKG